MTPDHSPVITPDQPAVGQPGEPCSSCGTPLAADQRYCLNCGARHGEPRLPYREYLSAAAAPAVSAAQPAANGSVVPLRGRDTTIYWAVGGLVALGVMLVVGVLLGKGSGPGAPIVKVGSAGPVASTQASGSSLNTANETFKDDWPSGKDGWTVELGSLSKSGATPTDVSTQKSDLTSKGAKDVGALDSDNYGSLPGGNYILYSGVYDTKAEAAKAQKGLTGSFPDAKVVQVSAKASAGSGSGTKAALSQKALQQAGATTLSKSSLQNLSSASGNDYEKQSQKLPEVIATGGKPPPKDTQAPGAGGSGTVIK